MTPMDTKKNAHIVKLSNFLLILNFSILINGLELNYIKYIDYTTFSYFICELCCCKIKLKCYNIKIA